MRVFTWKTFSQLALSHEWNRHIFLKINHARFYTYIDWRYIRRTAIYKVVWCCHHYTKRLAGPFLTPPAKRKPWSPRQRMPKKMKHPDASFHVVENDKWPNRGPLYWASAGRDENAPGSGFSFKARLFLCSENVFVLLVPLMTRKRECWTLLLIRSAARFPRKTSGDVPRISCEIFRLFLRDMTQEPLRNSDLGTFHCSFIGFSWEWFRHFRLIKVF